MVAVVFMGSAREENSSVRIIGSQSAAGCFRWSKGEEERKAKTSQKMREKMGMCCSIRAFFGYLLPNR